MFRFVTLASCIQIAFCEWVGALQAVAALVHVPCAKTKPCKGLFTIGGRHDEALGHPHSPPNGTLDFESNLNPF